MPEFSQDIVTDYSAIEAAILRSSIEGAAIAENVLTDRFGSRVTHWPRPLPEKPHFWELKKCKHEAQIKSTVRSLFHDFELTDKDREKFYDHLNYGQCVNEDAGGFIWRCWAAMLKLPYVYPLRQQDIDMMELEKTLTPCPLCKSPAKFFVGGFGEKQARCSNEACGIGLPPDQWQGDFETAKLAWEQLISRSAAKT